MQLFASATPGGGNLRTISKTRDECPICLLSAIRAKTFRMCAPSIHQSHPTPHTVLLGATYFMKFASPGNLLYYFSQSHGFHFLFFTEMRSEQRHVGKE